MQVWETLATSCQSNMRSYRGKEPADVCCDCVECSSGSGGGSKSNCSSSNSTVSMFDLLSL